MLAIEVIVIEHDEERMMLKADHLIDIGPGAGVHGGYVVAQGPPSAHLGQRVAPPST